ncbi:rCG30305 [Rattus norvegicus]|uniref:RCG30305 n=1 Tax=Rattus norvegicus TaxID=10116 RepID=A6IL34_RAT|nr:rCG30305 [Rattus norvegicus]
MSAAPRAAARRRQRCSSRFRRTLTSEPAQDV